MPAKENMQNFFGKVDRTFKRQSEEEYRINQITSPKVSWGPSPEDMDDVVKYCEHHSARANVMKTIWSLLTGTNSKSWKQIYKTLLLIEHLLINASPDTVRDIQGHLNIIQTLEDFRYKDEEGVDRGINVRKRAETVRELAMSEDIDEKRRNAAETRQRYLDVAQNNASGLASNFSVKQKVPIYTSSESVAMRPNAQNTSFAAKPNASMHNTSMTSQTGQSMGTMGSAPGTMGLQPQNHSLTSFASQNSLYQNSGMNGAGMGMPRPAGAIPMPANPMHRVQSQPMTMQAQAQIPAQPMQSQPQLQPIQMLTPEQMMAMTPEQLQAYQQQMLQQQQQMLAMMQQQQQQQQAATMQMQALVQHAPMPSQQMYQQPMMQAATPMSAMTPVTQAKPQLQPPMQQMQPQAPAAQKNNVADLISFF